MIAHQLYVPASNASCMCYIHWCLSLPFFSRSCSLKLYARLSCPLSRTAPWWLLKPETSKKHRNKVGMVMSDIFWIFSYRVCRYLSYCNSNNHTRVKMTFLTMEKSHLLLHGWTFFSCPSLLLLGDQPLAERFILELLKLITFSSTIPMVSSLEATVGTKIKIGHKQRYNTTVKLEGNKTHGQAV